MRRLVQLPKSQVFVGTQPPPPASGAQTLDLSRPPVEISQPGFYVLDRNWSVGFNNNAAIVITADDVTLDMQGFEVTMVGGGISSSGSNVTIRNGRVSGRGTAIAVSGAFTRIQNVRASVDEGKAINLGGSGSVLTDSVASVGGGGSGGTAVSAGSGTIVRGNFISGLSSAAIAMGYGATVTDNVVSGCVDEPCIVVSADNNIIARNRIDSIEAANGEGLWIVGNHNIAVENVFRGCGQRPAILVEGQGNTIRENLAPKCEGEVGGVGIAFLRDGNFYGDNTMWATVPFNVGATVQSDLGGNTGFST